MNISFSLLFDPLAVFFLILITTISIPVFIYSFGYLRGHYTGPKVFFGHILFVLFVASMLCVVMVGNAFTFLIAWEIMSLVSYFLVIFDSEHEKSIQAGTIYIIMTHIGTAFLIAAFLIMYKHCGSFDYAVMKSSLATLPQFQKNILFLLLFAGFGTKAGIVPLHIWLPYAHPQAPSHISALMSGVMIKTAIYGILRFIFLILGISALWWGGLMIIFGCVSCLVGIIYALLDRDIKTLLAYSSVENMGIILLGTGAAMMFSSMGLSMLSALALCAALYHLINHAAFKSLLFMGAGSVYNATGTRDMEKMGGLIKNMPWTSGYFLIGAASISALPPLNGFVSEWLILISLFLGAMFATGGLKLFLALAAAALALTGGLAAACFVKAFGITFLGRPRSQKAETAKEAGPLMNFGMGIMALLTVALGLGAVFVIRVLANVAACVLNMDAANINLSLNWHTLAPQAGKGIFLSTPMIAAIMIAAAVLIYVIVRLSFGRAKVTAGPTWDCGYYELTPRNEYTATGFSKPFRLAFSFFLLPYRKLQKIKESSYHVTSFIYETHTVKIFREFFYKKLVGGAFNTAMYMRGIQAGSIQIYLGYIFVAVLAMLIFAGRF